MQRITWINCLGIIAWKISFSLHKRMFSGIDFATISGWSVSSPTGTSSGSILLLRLLVNSYRLRIGEKMRRGYPLHQFFLCPEPHCFLSVLGWPWFGSLFLRFVHGRVGAVPMLLVLTAFQGKDLGGVSVPVSVIC